MSSKSELKTSQDIMADDDAFRGALGRAVQGALLRHKQTGLPIVTSVGGKLTSIPPDRIVLLEALTDHKP